ncbi:hypothetical protein C8R47DRAFT_133687 [Mycena vitilis]|nr:hypothetical protein C8R47DRAFT_133687 [Mycena vitilis]
MSASPPAYVASYARGAAAGGTAAPGGGGGRRGGEAGRKGGGGGAIGRRFCEGAEGRHAKEEYTKLSAFTSTPPAPDIPTNSRSLRSARTTTHSSGVSSWPSAAPRSTSGVRSRTACLRPIQARTARRWWRAASHPPPRAKSGGAAAPPCPSTSRPQARSPAPTPATPARRQCCQCPPTTRPRPAPCPGDDVATLCDACAARCATSGRSSSRARRPRAWTSVPL